MRTYIRRFVPAPLKSWIRAALRAIQLRGIALRIARLPVGQSPDRDTLTRLKKAWGNEGFAAKIEYLEEVARRGATVTGPVLECGSGLTTILLGLLAARRGVEVWTLEHLPHWHGRVARDLKRCRIGRVKLCLAPLRQDKDFSWYDAPLDQMPDRFSLVICDGPRGDTYGGRFGLLPTMGTRLPGGTVILVDDAQRAREADVLRRWESCSPLVTEIREGPSGSYAVVTLR